MDSNLLSPNQLANLAGGQNPQSSNSPIPTGGLLTRDQLASYAAKSNPSNPTSNVGSSWDAFDKAINSTPQSSDVNAEKASFPTTGEENPLFHPLNAAARTVGNIPASTIGFGKSILDFLNPLNTAKTISQIPGAFGEAVQANGGVGRTIENTLTSLPGEAYKATVPLFLQHIFSGDLKKAAATIENDPVGQIAPLLMVAKGAAEKIGKGAEFNDAITKVTSPVTKAISNTANKIGEGTTKAATQVAGMSTGAGASSIQEAFKAGKTGGQPLEAFTKALRGETQPEEVINSAQNIVNNIKENRGNSYVQQLKNIGEDKTTHDISPVVSGLKEQLGKFNIKETKDGLDFSRSSIANNGTARADVQGVYDTIKDWGSQTGDRTGVGLDTLKKQLSDFYSPSSQARAFVQGVKSPVLDILNNEVKGYKEMTGGYSKASNMLDEIKSATGAGSKAKPDTVFTKLTTAMKGDKDFRLEVMKEMTKTDPEFMAKIAGTNLNSWIPRGLVGKGADIGALSSVLFHAFNPEVIPMLLTTSPRIMGEFVRGLGMGAAKSTEIINTVKKIGALKNFYSKNDNTSAAISDNSKNVSIKSTIPEGIEKSTPEQTISNHISEAKDVLREVPEVAKSDMKGFLQQTKTNIVDGLRHDGMLEEANRINAIDTSKVKTLNQLEKILKNKN